MEFIHHQKAEGLRAVVLPQRKVSGPDQEVVQHFVVGEEDGFYPGFTPVTQTVIQNREQEALGLADPVPVATMVERVCERRSA